MQRPGPAHGGITRRRFLGGLAGIGGLALVNGLVAACGRGGTSGGPAGLGGSASPGGELTFGSNQSDAVPRAAMQAVVDAFEGRTGVSVRVNTVDSSTFQDQIGSYLQGTPDDVFTWFAGDRMRFFADQGLTGDLTAVWESIGDRYEPAYREVSIGSDGRPGFVPFATYPWVVLYRRSTWTERGYEVPATLEDLRTLAARMRADGLVPFAFGNREGWPAMGTFDILDLRRNGHDFHTGLLRGRERWTDERVRGVFELWRELLPLHQAGAQGRTWQDAAKTLLNGEAGMYFMGTFAGEQADAAGRTDLEMFEFPALGTAFDGERAIDAPINGFMMRREPRNPAAAAAFLEFVGSPEAQKVFLDLNPNRIATARDADRSGYTDYQRRMADVIARAGRITQFLDRDTRPDFAGPNGLQAFFADFLSDPDQDLEPYLAGIQAFWDSLT